MGRLVPKLHTMRSAGNGHADKRAIDGYCDGLVPIDIGAPVAAVVHRADEQAAIAGRDIQ